MKKTICVLLSLVLLLFAAGCGGTASQADAEPTAASAAAQPVQTPAAAETVSAAPLSPGEEAATPAPSAAEADPVDVDLTLLSSTMVYSEVYAMVYEPEQYLGKTVKMQGLFATQEYEGTRLYACVIQDATACCAQGLEFELAEALSYPEDFPEEGAEITVVGTFDTYTEDAGNGNVSVYLVLRAARMI